MTRPTYSGHSRANQARAEQIIERDIYCRQNSTMDLFFEANDDLREEIANYELAKCPHCGEDVKDVDQCAAPDDATHGMSYTCPHCEGGFEDCEHGYAEVYEWWAVSEFLAEKLKAAGEVVWEGPDVWIWGRTVTGQNILLDGTIQKVVAEWLK